MSFVDEVVVEYAMWCICFRGLVCALLWSYSVWKIVQCLIFHIFYCLIYSSKLSYMLIWEGPLIDTYLEWNDAPCLRFLNSPISLILHSSIYANDCRFLCQKIMCTLRWPIGQTSFLPKVEMPIIFIFCYSQIICNHCSRVQLMGSFPNIIRFGRSCLGTSIKVVRGTGPCPYSSKLNAFPCIFFPPCQSPFVIIFLKRGYWFTLNGRKNCFLLTYNYHPCFVLSIAEWHSIANLCKIWSLHLFLHNLPNNFLLLCE